MDDLSLLIDLHRDGARQGPGGERETRLALQLAGLSEISGLRIADVGCGTGASTLILASECSAHITAVDFVSDFLIELEGQAVHEGLQDKIETLAVLMEEMPFGDATLDAIWCEGAIYNLGFEQGIRAWRRFIKPGGILAVSELTWLTADRPQELQDHWESEYPEVDTASEKMNLLEANGYTPMGYFSLPKSCWLDNYYRPMQRRFDGFLARHDNSRAAMAIVAAEQVEIGLYEQFADFVSYGFYVARKLPGDND